MTQPLLLIVDIDGTVIEGPEGKFANKAEDVRVYPAAVKALQLHKDLGGRILAVSNQGGIALGYTTPEQVADKMREVQKQCGGSIDNIRVCPHYFEDDDDTYLPCFCRKPSPGLAIDGIAYLMNLYKEEYKPAYTMFVGDRAEDQACAQRLEVKFMWAHEWRDLHE